MATRITGVKRSFGDMEYVPPSEEAKNKAASVIQRYVRTFLENRQCTKLDGVPHAEGGARSFVYLPPKIRRIVIKTEREKPDSRAKVLKQFCKTEEVRSIVEKQGSTHLRIPKMRIYKNCIIAERLPVNINNYYNMWVYLNNLSAFDSAVREMTRLYKEKELNDILTYTDSFLAQVDQRKVRPDNLPLGLVEKEGRKEGVIMLIDLKQISTPEQHHLPQLARIFSYHLQVIEEEATRMQIPFDHHAMEDASNRGKQYLKFGYTDFAQYLKDKGIVPQDPPKLFGISSERREKLQALVVAELYQLNAGINPIYGKLEPEKPATPPKNFIRNEDIPKLAKEFTNSIVTKLERAIFNPQRRASSEWDLVDSRTLEIKRHRLFNESAEHLEENSTKDLRHSDAENTCDQLTIVIVQELIKSGDLFFFDPGYYTQEHKTCWIRY